MEAINIGVISDTHSLMRPQALEALRGSDLILHAGDVGDPAVLEPLRELAPLHVVRGNIDFQPWADVLTETDFIEVGGRFIYLLHNINHLDIDPQAAEIDVVVFGHSHRPCNELRDGVLYFNPASAGPRRFNLPIAVGRICVDDNGISAEHIIFDL